MQQDDHARPLNPRGRRAAPLMGAWLADEGYVPDAALVSTAMRTRQTWARLSPLLPEAPEPQFRDDLYLADIEQMMAAIREAGEARCLLVLGHNPGIESLVMLLSASPRKIPMPTCAAAILEVGDQSWSDLAMGGASLTAFETPKSLV